MAKNLPNSRFRFSRFLFLNAHRLSGKYFSDVAMANDNPLAMLKPAPDAAPPKFINILSMPRSSIAAKCSHQQKFGQLVDCRDFFADQKRNLQTKNRKQGKKRPAKAIAIG